MSLRPTDFDANPQSDRDLECLRNRMKAPAPKLVNNMSSKASYTIVSTKAEDSFSNSIIEPRNMNVQSRFMPKTTQNVKNANKMRFEGFQA